MKKYFLTLALSFGMVISYAGNSTPAFDAATADGLSQETTQWVLNTADHLDAGLLQAAPSTVDAAEKYCKLEFDGSIDGKKVKMTVIVHGVSCMELLKALM